MQEWEYIRVCSNPYGCEIYEKEGKMTETKDDLDITMNRLGSEGWELVGIGSHDYSRDYYIFKRQVS